MVRRDEPIVEEVEESFELLACDIGDDDRGVVCCFLGALLPFVGRLWKVKHIPEKPSLRHEEVLVYAIEATVDLNASQEIMVSPFADIPDIAIYLKNSHIGVHIVLRVTIHARTAERGIEIE